MNLPEKYINRMRALLGDEWQAYENEMLCGEPKRGLRVNTLRLSVEDFKKISPFRLESSPLCRESFIISGDESVGVHPFHHAGLFYMQEPSASSVIEALDPQPGMRVLDLCAAPGGKSTHIAARLQGKGVLVSNECVSSRTRALSSNIERIGARNAAVISAMPQKLSPSFDSFFDAVAVDAPCSGEGMFRREPEALTNWSEENVKSCARRQIQILDEAAKMTAGGGVLIYSTCTLSPDEDEGVCDEFLKNHPDFHMEEITSVKLPHARPEWADADESIRLAARLMPHEVPGEGHFVAKMRKDAGIRNDFATQVKSSPLSRDEMKLFREFWESTFRCDIWCEPEKRGDSVWLCPEEVRGIAAIRPGVPAGTFLKNRFEPEHGLFMAMNSADVITRLELDAGDEAVGKFLRGETLSAEGKGWCAVCVKAGGMSFVIGFGKVSGGVLKNHYPKGLRNLK